MSASAVLSSVYLLFAFPGSDRGGLDLYVSEDGLAWRTLAIGSYRPAIGEWGIFRDPCVHRDEAGVFHLVWTTGESGFGYARSADAVNWSGERYVRVADPERDLDFKNVWAPHIHQHEDRALIVWSSTLRRDYVPPANQDEWWTATWSHRLYFTTTRDWEVFTPTERFWDPGHNVIDAKIVRRGPDDYRLFYKDERREHKNVIEARGAAPLGPFERPRALTGAFTEGAIFLRRGTGDYLLYYDLYKDRHGYAALPSTDGETYGEPVKLVKDERARVLRHGSIVTVDRETLAVVERALAERGAP